MRHHRRVESRAPQPSPSIAATRRSGPRGGESLFGRWPVAEHHILRLGLALSASLLVAALIAFTLPGVPAGHWAGTHLALAGAALVAIGTFMPHFGVTLAGAPPERPALRMATIAALALGAVSVVAGVLAAVSPLIVAGAIGLWAGLGLVALTTFRPLRQPLARRHPIVQLAYGAALAQVALGIALPVLFFVGWEPALSAWNRLRPAHVWLNLFGFISLTIAATLVYLYPTVLGARIRAHASLALMVGGMAGGPPIAVAGLVLPLPLLTVAGAMLTAVGGAGQLWYGWTVWRGRGRWTTDAAWHGLAIGHLTAGMAWFLFAAALAAVDVIDGGLPADWGLGALGMPLLGGWVIQVLVGAWTHLLPAVAARGHDVRAAQRTLLGRWPWARLVAWNGGVLLAWAGLSAGMLPVALAGIAAFTAAALVSAGLVFAALMQRQRSAPTEHVPRSAA